MNHIEKVHQLLAQGSEYKKKGLIKEAISEFSKAIIGIHLIFKTEHFDQDNELKFVKQVQIPCFLKLCSCYLKQHDELSKVMVLCNDVLDIDCNNAKAYYMRAQVHTILKDFEKALKDVNRARENQPENKKFRDLQSNIRRKKKESQEIVKINISSRVLFAKGLLSICKHRKS